MLSASTPCSSYVGLRTLEAAVIAIGVVPLLAISTLRGELGGGRTDTLVTVGDAFVALHDGTFLVGPGLVCGVNTTVIAVALLRSGLVPRFVPVLGLVGGPLVLGSAVATMFGVYGQSSPVAAAAAAPVFAWEICLAAYLLVKGFRTVPPAPTAAAPAVVLAGSSA